MYLTQVLVNAIILIEPFRFVRRILKVKLSLPTGNFSGQTSKTQCFSLTNNGAKEVNIDTLNIREILQNVGNLRSLICSALNTHELSQLGIGIAVLS